MQGKRAVGSGEWAIGNTAASYTLQAIQLIAKSKKPKALSAFGSCYFFSSSVSWRRQGGYK